MNAKELRIGNYIDYLDKIIQCTANTIHAISKVIGNSALYKPIPLTEEWLLKFGFDNPNGNCHFELEPMRFFIQKEFGHFELTIYHTFIDKERFKYVHQLQNLYFALTGEELNHA